MVCSLFCQKQAYSQVSFLPGDSLLLLSGIARELVETFFIFQVIFKCFCLTLLIATAATLGNIFGCWFGARSGQFLYDKEKCFSKYLYQSQEFFEKHGVKLYIFMILTYNKNCSNYCQIVHMKKSRFMFYNILSSLLWSFILVFAGHYLYEACS
jgi:membrane-associated protein